MQMYRSKVASVANVAHLLALCCFQRKNLPVRPQSTCSSCSARSSMLGLLKQPSRSNGLCCEDPKFVKYFSVWRQDLEISLVGQIRCLTALIVSQLLLLRDVKKSRNIVDGISCSTFPPTGLPKHSTSYLPQSRSSACGTCVGACNSSTSKKSQKKHQHPT